MAQRIKLVFAGKEFQLNAETPEAENLMRFAAEEVDKRMAVYDQKFATTEAFDKLAFVALGCAMGNLKNFNMLNKAEKEAEDLTKTLEAYLQSVETEKNR
ncbi:MAG: cell division protein ZapA [Bacteroidales bacterium]|nr:cell division protein ZapA [Bacteroidales bacterium]